MPCRESVGYSTFHDAANYQFSGYRTEQIVDNSGSLLLAVKNIGVISALLKITTQQNKRLLRISAIRRNHFHRRHRLNLLDLIFQLEMSIASL